MTTPEPQLPPALRLLWEPDTVDRRSRGLTREAIISAAIEVADADGLGALSMARIAERLGCGTMSLYRYVTSKDDLVTFMLSTAPGPPPSTPVDANWHVALHNWAIELWNVYHRHPWILHTGTSGPPADPGQLAWLDAGLAALADTGLSEREKFSAVIAVLHFVRGAAALAIDAQQNESTHYPALLRQVVTPAQFPALAAALQGGVFDEYSESPLADLEAGLAQLLDGIVARITP
jgi:AcrR family transcriptional regulator